MRVCRRCRGESSPPGRLSGPPVNPQAWLGRQQTLRPSNVRLHSAFTSGQSWHTYTHHKLTLKPYLFHLACPCFTHVAPWSGSPASRRQPVPCACLTIDRGRALKSTTGLAVGFHGRGDRSYGQRDSTSSCLRLEPIPRGRCSEVSTSTCIP